MKAAFFRTLTKEEVEEFRTAAHNEFHPGDEIKSTWHPVYQNECRYITADYDRMMRKQSGTPVRIGSDALINAIPVKVVGEDSMMGVEYWRFTYHEYGADVLLQGICPKVFLQ